MTASVTFGTAAQRARSGTELVAERRSAEVTYLQPNATCCKMLQDAASSWVGFWWISDGFLPLVASFKKL